MNLYAAEDNNVLIPIDNLGSADSIFHIVLDVAAISSFAVIFIGRKSFCDPTRARRIDLFKLRFLNFLRYVFEGLRTVKWI